MEYIHDFEEPPRVSFKRSLIIFIGNIIGICLISYFQLGVTIQYFDDIALFGNTLTHTINTKIFYEIDELFLPYKIDLVNFNTLENEIKFKENILKEGVEIYAK